MDTLPEQALYSPMFDLVKTRANWKYPIAAIVFAPGGERDFALWSQVMERAIEFYAGGGARIEVVGAGPQGLSRKVRVTAPGYYEMVGA